MLCGCDRDAAVAAGFEFTRSIQNFFVAILNARGEDTLSLEETAARV